MRQNCCMLVIAVFVATGCSTRLEDRRLSGPQSALVPGATAVANGQPNSRSVALSGENTRVTFVGTAGPTSHEGDFEHLAGEWNLPTNDPKDSRLNVRIEMASVHTRIGLLTTHLKREDFFDVKQFPTATFVSTRIEPQRGSEGSTHLVTGEFTIHGVTKPVSFPAKISIAPNAVALDGKFAIAQTAFGMATAAEKTRDEVPVTVSINAARR